MRRKTIKTVAVMLFAVLLLSLLVPVALAEMSDLEAESTVVSELPLTEELDTPADEQETPPDTDEEVTDPEAGDENAAKAENEDTPVTEDAEENPTPQSEESIPEDNTNETEQEAEDTLPLVPEDEQAQETEVPPPAREPDKLYVQDATVFAGDTYYTVELLPSSLVVVLRSAEQVTHEYSIVVSDTGGYDPNVPGEYGVTFIAQHKTDPAVEPLSKQVIITVKELPQVAMRRAAISLLSGTTRNDNYTLAPDIDPVGTAGGYSIYGDACDFHGYRNGQIVPTSGDIQLYGGTQENFFWKYYVRTTEGLTVPIYCVEPNISDLAPDGSWMGRKGYMYGNISNDNGATGAFHQTAGSWALATETQRKMAAAAGYFSRPEADVSSANGNISDSYYVAAQVLVWECLTGVVDTNYDSATFMEPVASISYYDLAQDAFVTGNYHNYANSTYQKCIIGNNLPDYGYPTLEAYETIKARMKAYYAIPSFMFARAASAAASAALYELPHPSEGGGRKFSASAAVLQSIDWNALTADSRISVNTSTISQGYVTISAKSEIAKTSPAVTGYAKAGTRNNVLRTHFMSLAGNQWTYNGKPTGQTKMQSQTIDPMVGYMGFYTRSVSTGQLIIRKEDTSGNLITGAAVFQIVAAADIKVNGVTKWAAGTVVETLTTGVATFDRDTSGNVTTTKVTTSDSGVKVAPGIAVSSHLPVGSYTIVEQTAPSGYVGNWRSAANLTTHGQTLSFTAKNTKQKVEVLKVDADYIDNHLEGAEFDLFEKQPDGSWKLVDHLVTDNTGTAVSDKIKNGDYKMVETKAPEGYTSGWEQEFTVTSKDSLIELVATDKKQKVEVLKVDADYIENHLEGAEFDLFEKQPDGSWELVDHLVTDDTGTAISDKVKNGDYKMVETKAPEGYTSGWEQEFTVTEDDELIELVATDKKQKVEVLKVDADYIDNHLEGAEFDLFEKQPDGSWELVDQLVTDDTGTAISDKVKNGDYKMVETKAPEGYTSGWEQEFTVTEEDELIELVATDKKQKIEISKVDAYDNSLPLAGAEFELYQEQADGSWRLADRLVTGADGKAGTDKVSNGNWKLVEVVAPVGYVPAADILFTIQPDDEILTFTIPNKIIESTVMVLKYDSADGKKLSGVVFEIRDDSGAVVAEIITDENGRASYLLPYGAYTVKEIRTVSGYKPNDKTFEFEVRDEGATIPILVANDRKYGTMDIGIPRKQFPRTSVTPQIIEQYEFTDEDGENPDYAVPLEIVRDGVTYNFESVVYELLQAPMRETVTLTDLEDGKCPATYELEQDGVTTTLVLQDAEYTVIPSTETVTHEIDFGYRESRPAADETVAYAYTAADGSTKEAELPLYNVELVDDYAWRSIVLDAVFYGDSSVYGFSFADGVIIPYRLDAPTWEGYEADILKYLGLSPNQYRITGAEWVDPDFVVVDGVSQRRAAFHTQVYAGHWVARYTGEVETGETTQAVAVYATAETDFLFTATATYTAAPALTVAGRALPMKTVVIIVGVVLLIVAAVLVIFVLAKKRRRRMDDEDYID